MDKNTRKALEGSIRKWEGIVAGTKKDRGVNNCPLCEMFNNEESEYMCDGCPVADAADDDGCSGTPYMRWSRLFTGQLFPYVADTDEKRAAAQAELDFLISLRL